MTRTSEDRDLYDWDANEIEEQPQSSLISKAEQNISSSCQHLEQTFKDINRDFDAPCPVKLIRRLTSLEIALSQLKKDCETISSKRRSIVQSVISDQNENVGHFAKVCHMITDEKNFKFLLFFDFCLFSLRSLDSSLI